MPVLDDVHDFAHPVEGDEAWSESYYFNAYDPVSDSGVFTRMAVRPHDGTIDVGLSAWLPGTQLATVRGVRDEHEMIDTGLEVAGVRYERVTPMKEWHVSAEGDARVVDLAGREPPRTARLALFLTFEALAPAIGTDGQGRAGSGASAATGATVGKGHLEQPGRWHGWIALDDERHELADARGNRDKSWGPRRWGGPRMWRWFSVNIGDDVHFGGIRIGTDAGDLHRGWVWRDGEATSIREWDVRTELADDGITHRVSHVRATDKRDRVHELRADVLRVAGAPHEVRQGEGATASVRRTLLNEGLARWTYAGVAGRGEGPRTGYGISEYLHQLGDDDRPLVPIE